MWAYVARNSPSDERVNKYWQPEGWSQDLSRKNLCQWILGLPMIQKPWWCGDCNQWQVLQISPQHPLPRRSFPRGSLLFTLQRKTIRIWFSPSIGTSRWLWSFSSDGVPCSTLRERKLGLGHSGCACLCFLYSTGVRRYSSKLVMHSVPIWTMIEHLCNQRIEPSLAFWSIWTLVRVWSRRLHYNGGSLSRSRSWIRKGFRFVVGDATGWDISSKVAL